MVAALGAAGCGVAPGVVPSLPGVSTSRDAGLSGLAPMELDPTLPLERLVFVIVMELIRLSLADRNVLPDPRDPAPERRVARSVPSCAAAPSRSIWIKYGPHLLATMREFTGIRSPPTARISISANSLDASARAPKSAALEFNVRPPAFQGLNLLPVGRAGSGIVGAGLEADTKLDIGVVFLGLSYSPNASSSTIQTLLKFSLR